MGFIVTTLLSVTQPGNSTGHGHRAFDTGTHEGTLRALRGMTDMAGWFSKEEEKKA